MSYLSCEQIWLDPPVDGCQCGYITKVNKNNPNSNFRLGIAISSILSKSYISTFVHLGFQGSQ